MAGMGVKNSIRRAEARFLYETETKPRLEREAAERKAKLKALSAESDARLKRLGVDMSAIRAKYRVGAS